MSSTHIFWSMFHSYIKMFVFRKFEKYVDSCYCCSNKIVNMLLLLLLFHHNNQYCHSYCNSYLLTSIFSCIRIDYRLSIISFEFVEDARLGIGMGWGFWKFVCGFEAFYCFWKFLDVWNPIYPKNNLGGWGLLFWEKKLRSSATTNEGLLEISGNVHSAQIPKNADFPFV